MRELGRSYKTFAYPASIFVINDNVYIAGYAYSESDPMLRGRVADPVPCLWMDDKILFLDETGYGKTNSVFVSGKKIYTAGFYRNGSGRYFACLWIYDGAAVTRTDIMSGSIKDDYPTQATSVFVSSDTVYVTGSVTDGSERFAYLWKYSADGVQIESNKLALDGFNDIKANSIFVSDNNVYIASNYKNHEQLKTAVSIWTNNEQTVISDEPDATPRSVYAADGTVYMCGDYSVSKAWRAACIWQLKDSGIIKNALYPQGSSCAYSVFTSQSDVYAAGSYRAENKPENKPENKNTACCWKNGEMIGLAGYGSHNAEASSIYIREK